MKFIGVTGHQGIPRVALPSISGGIRRVLRRLSGQFTGVSSLAEGADQLFAEIVLQEGGRLHVIIPCQEYEAAFEDHKAVMRFRKLLKAADAVERLDHLHQSETAFLDAGKRVVDLSHILIAVWDGGKARGKGGTGDIVEYARQQRIEVIVVWPHGMPR